MARPVARPTEVPPEPPGGGGTAPKALLLLDALGRAAGPVRLAELAAGCGLSKPSAHRVLVLLRELGWVRPHQGGRYSLGARAYAFAASAGRPAGVEQVLTGLRDAVGHTVHAGVLSGDVVVYTHKIEGHDQFAMRSRVGGTMPAHCTGIGKVLLARLPGERLDRVLSAGLARRTPNTLTDPAALRRELKRVAELGYALDEEENEPNVRCVAAAVPAADGRPVAAVSIATVTFLTAREQLLGHVPALRTAAEELAGRL